MSRDQDVLQFGHCTKKAALLILITAASIPWFYTTRGNACSHTQDSSDVPEPETSCQPPEKENLLFNIAPIWGVTLSRSVSFLLRCKRYWLIPTVNYQRCHFLANAKAATDKCYLEQQQREYKQRLTPRWHLCHAAPCNWGFQIQHPMRTEGRVHGGK